LALRYQLKVHGSKLSTEAAQSIESKCAHLQDLIDAFQTRADFFLPHRHSIDDLPASLPAVDDVFDSAGEPLKAIEHADQITFDSFDHTSLRSLDGSGMSIFNPETFPILLPSSLGLEWCMKHGIQSLAVKEARLCYAQANYSIHQIRLDLGFKSALFRTQIRSAETQKAKTRAWTTIDTVNATVQEHKHIYNMSRDAYQKVQPMYAVGPDLPLLCHEDLYVETSVLGSEQVGQRNTQRSWIWGFGKTVDDEGTWMNDCKLYHRFMFICSHIKQLIGCTGYVPKHNLKDGWKNRTAYTMRLTGFLLTFIRRQRCGRIS
jgi:hypothetical protein